MAILRNKTREQFTVVNSAILKDKTLSLKERGMLVTFHFQIIGTSALRVCVVSFQMVGTLYEQD